MDENTQMVNSALDTVSPSHLLEAFREDYLWILAETEAMEADDSIYTEADIRGLPYVRDVFWMTINAARNMDASNASHEAE